MLITSMQLHPPCCCKTRPSDGFEFASVPIPLMRRLPAPMATPADSFRTCVMFRRAGGNSRTFKVFKLSRCSGPSVLTNGEPPSTVMVSVRLPTLRTCACLTTCEATRAMSVLWYVLNPSDSILKVYVPTGSTLKAKSPLSPQVRRERQQGHRGKVYGQDRHSHEHLFFGKLSAPTALGPDQ